MIGLKIPEDRPVWQMLMSLKSIVELVMSQSHIGGSICYFDSLILEHRSRLLEAFPQQKLIPKYHFLEHYPQLTREFGPVAALWTMRFEAKHSFFKTIVRQTGCFKNILLTLANKHHLMILNDLHDLDAVKLSLSVTQTTEVSLEVCFSSFDCIHSGRKTSGHLEARYLLPFLVLWVLPKYRY